MKFFFRFTRGEWIAVIAIMVIVITAYISSFFINNFRDENFDVSSFEEEVNDFMREQQRLADSVTENRRLKYASMSGLSYPKNTAYKGNGVHAIQDSTKKRGKKIQYEIVKVEINTCDTSDVIRIPQFGSKRAIKLLEYRDQLGGFYSISQFKEVYILQSLQEDFLSTYFQVDRNTIKKIKVNEADYSLLTPHPYIDAYLAKSILHYRQKHGRINNLQELKEATHAYPELLEKLGHYIDFE